MDEVEQKSCWGVTAWAVVAFAGVIAVAWLFGGHEVVALATAR